MFYVVTLSFIAGIVVRSIVAIDVFYVYTCVLLAVAICPFVRDKRVQTILVVVALFLFLGFLRLEIRILQAQSIRAQHGEYYGKKVVIEAVVADEPDIREKNIKYTLGKLYLLEGQQRLVGNILMTTRLYPRFYYGDAVRLTCSMQEPKPFDGFAYDVYIAQYNIYSLCYYPSSITYLGKEEKAPLQQFKRYIFLAKNNFIVHLKNILPAPYSGLLAGLLIGDTSYLPTYLKQQFIDTGTIHIVAISGYNITILAGIFLFVAPYLYIKRRIAWCVIIPVLIIFVVLTGAEASVVRAAIMGIVAALATEGGRVSDVGRLLVLTGVIMLLVNPFLMRFDVGFQLSFMATIGLVYGTPFFEKALAMGKEKFIAPLFLGKRKKVGKIYSLFVRVGRAVLQPLKHAAISTICATMAVAPVLAWHFGRVSFISPIVNTLILWAIPFAMALGFVAALASYLFLPLGIVFGFGAWLLLEYIIEVVQFF